MWGVIGTSPRNVVYGPPPSPEWSAAECPKIPHLHEPLSTSRNPTLLGTAAAKSSIEWITRASFNTPPPTWQIQPESGTENHWHFASENLKNRRKNTHPKPKSATISLPLASPQAQHYVAWKNGERRSRHCIQKFHQVPNLHRMALGSFWVSKSTVVHGCSMGEKNWDLTWRKQIWLKHVLFKHSVSGCPWCAMRFPSKKMRPNFEIISDRSHAHAGICIVD